MRFLQIDPAATPPVDSLQHQLHTTLTELSQMERHEMLALLSDWAIDFAIDVLVCIVIYVVGRWLVKGLDSFLSRTFTRRNVEISIAKFTRSLVRALLYIAIIYAIIGQLGVDTTSFLAIFASVGVGVGMAMSGTLQNFAGGVMVLLNHPFRIGDYIQTQGVEGTVKEIKLFTTTINTVDNKLIIVPNGGIVGNIINNYSAEQVRRVDWSVSISYGDDYEVTKAAIEALLKADKRVHQEPAPFVALGELGDGAVKVVVRAWAASADYWDLFFEMNEQFYKVLPTKGVRFPRPRIQVTMEQ